MKLTKKQKLEALSQIQEWFINNQNRVRDLAQSVEGIVAWYNEAERDLHTTLTGNNICYQFQIQSRVSHVVNMVKWCEKGLYSKVEGSTWHYAR